MKTAATSPLLSQLGFEHELVELEHGMIEVLDFGASQVRTDWDYRNDERVDDLEQAYRFGHDVEPMIVERIDSEESTPRFVLLAGNHRYAAWSRLNGAGPRTLPCWVVTEPLEPIHRDAIGLRENAKGSLPLRPGDRERAILEHKSLGAKKIAEWLELDEREVRTVLESSRLEDHLLEIGVTARVEPHLQLKTFRRSIKNASTGPDPELAERVSRAIPRMNAGTLLPSEVAHCVDVVKAAGHVSSKRMKALGEFDNYIDSSTTRASTKAKASSGARSVARLERIVSQVTTISAVEWRTYLSKPANRKRVERLRDEIAQVLKEAS